jgi:hypothetical protein
VIINSKTYSITEISNGKFKFLKNKFEFDIELSDRIGIFEFEIDNKF